MGDTVWHEQNYTLFKTPNICNYQPWRTVVSGNRTCTVDMCTAQEVQQKEKSAPVDGKDIAQVLHLRNLLRLTESIQISPNDMFY